jgi:hypothetical protein
VVECFLAKEDVAGSTPVSRSKYDPVCGTLLPPSAGQKQTSPAEARYPSGKGEVCKTFMRRFDPDPRLQYSSSTYGAHKKSPRRALWGTFCICSLNERSLWLPSCRSNSSARTRAALAAAKARGVELGGQRGPHEAHGAKAMLLAPPSGEHPQPSGMKTFYP